MYHPLLTPEEDTVEWWAIDSLSEAGNDGDGEGLPRKHVLRASRRSTLDTLEHIQSSQPWTTHLMVSVFEVPPRISHIHHLQPYYVTSMELY